METKEIASDKLATAVIVSILLLFVTIITAIVVTLDEMISLNAGEI